LNLNQSDKMINDDSEINPLEIKKRNELFKKIKELEKMLNISVYSISYINKDIDVDDTLDMSIEN
jgi:hypothetical protein